MKILQGNGMCTMFLCGFEIDRKLSKHWAIESVAKYTIVIGIFEFPQFANMPTILCQPFYLSTATKRPPLISLRRMRSRPSLIPSSPLTVPTTSGGTKSPFTSNRSHHALSASPTSATSWKSLMGTLCSATPSGISVFGSPVKPTRCDDWVVDDISCGVDGGVGSLAPGF
jgi:hypothetical protein